MCDKHECGVSKTQTCGQNPDVWSQLSRVWLMFGGGALASFLATRFAV